MWNEKKWIYETMTVNSEQYVLSLELWAQWAPCLGSYPSCDSGTSLEAMLLAYSMSGQRDASKSILHSHVDLASDCLLHLSLVL